VCCCVCVCVCGCLVIPEVPKDLFDFLHVPLVVVGPLFPLLFELGKSSVPLPRKELKTSLSTARDAQGSATHRTMDPPPPPCLVMASMQGDGEGDRGGLWGKGTHLSFFVIG